MAISASSATGRMRLLVDAAADAVQQHDAPSELAQHVGQMRRDRKRTAEARADRCRAPSPGWRWRASSSRACADWLSVTSADCASATKRPSTARGLAAEDRFLLVLHAREARLVARRNAGHEPRAEHLLHLGETAEAERVREADDRRGLHARRAAATSATVPSAISVGWSSTNSAICCSRPEARGAAGRSRRAARRSSSRLVGSLVHRRTLPRSRRFDRLVQIFHFTGDNRMFIL